MESWQQLFGGLWFLICSFTNFLPAQTGTACIALMHQSFETPIPTETGNSGCFNFSVYKALINALHCGHIFVKSLLKAPARWGVCVWGGGGRGDNKEQQMNWSIWINFLNLPLESSSWNMALIYFGFITHTHTHTEREREETYINCIRTQQNSYSEYSDVSSRWFKGLKIKQVMQTKDYIVSRQLCLAK